MHAELLKKAILEEARLLNDYAARLGKLRDAAARRDWEAVEKDIASLRNLAGEIETAEDARLESYRGLKASLPAGGELSFDQAASRLEPPEREQLAEAQQRLKIAVIRVKGASGLLSYCVRSMADARRQVLEELLPHRKGRLYSRCGRTRAAAEESLMLDGKY